jgi:uncharacterized protein
MVFGLLRMMALPLALIAAPAGAGCFGLNMLDTMPKAERQAIEDAAHAVPYPIGNVWSASKGEAKLTVVGTYHLNDDRHAAVVAALAPLVTASSGLLVEGGPEEQKAMLKHMADNPSLMTITEGPTLIEALPEDLWQDLSAAMAERGIPGFMAAKFQPWYISVMLAIPPCAVGEMAKPNGLDQQLIDTALAAKVPIKALEPFDTLFTLFEELTPAEQIAMIEQSLAMEPVIVDYSITMADAYFDGESRVIWELTRHTSYQLEGYTRERVDAELARMEDILMVQRNRAWIPVIEEAASAGPLVVAFGALHLSGEDGVLNLLAKSGWTIEPLALP